MPIITWTQDYSVGVAELDQHHQKLIGIINELFNLYQEKRFANTEVEPVFKELVDYADMHFSAEEHYFQLYNYEKKEEHTAMHNSYRQKIDDLKKQYDAENSEAALFAITNFLNDWWIWHINHTDKEYTAYFNANGLK